MITIISGTNRLGSNTLKVAHEYHRILKEKGAASVIFSLERLKVLERDVDFEKMEQDMIIPTNYFIFIVPEYNGSFPGVLKLLFDNSISNKIWFNKQALITGNSSGRAGNLRGMDHLADILNYMKITVHPNKLPISQVDKLMDAEGRFKDSLTLSAINTQLDEFLQWRQPIKKG